ncbi:hypothetical protein MDA_GLEAN10008196 [Myotis davidii]|uniref:Uncharacterized protein n=1 Tax=Myotis davidii TaxID=225400 RepID=L5MAN1_MYODS|nr:hypothetical protein MDA_GLEAN10008196 [Myotis davidii]
MDSGPIWGIRNELAQRRWIPDVGNFTPDPETSPRVDVPHPNTEPGEEEENVPVHRRQAPRPAPGRGDSGRTQ